MREYIRHHAGIPIFIIHDDSEYSFQLLNVSLGGLACKGEHSFEVNTKLNLRIPFLQPEYKAAGRVAWCKNADGLYEIGIEHVGEKDKERLVMVEQISHIEHYRNEVMLTEDRDLSGEEAAREWQEKHGSDY